MKIFSQILFEIVLNGRPLFTEIKNLSTLRMQNVFILSYTTENKQTL